FRNGRRTAFFSFQTVSAPANTREMWVSTGSAPDNARRKAAVLAWAGGTVMASREQLAGDPAAAGRAVIGRAVVQAEWHVLPELEPLRQDAVAGPVRRSGDVLTRIFRLELRQALLQHRAVQQRPGLEGGPGTEA